MINIIRSLVQLAIALAIFMFFQVVFWPTFRYMESNGQGWLFIIPFMLLAFGFIHWYGKKYPEPSYDIEDDE
jgi:hypothetical protein